MTETRERVSITSQLPAHVIGAIISFSSLPDVSRFEVSSSSVLDLAADATPYKDGVAALNKVCGATDKTYLTPDADGQMQVKYWHDEDPRIVLGYEHLTFRDQFRLLLAFVQLCIEKLTELIKNEPPNAREWVFVGNNLDDPTGAYAAQSAALADLEVNNVGRFNLMVKLVDCKLAQYDLSKEGAFHGLLSTILRTSFRDWFYDEVYEPFVRRREGSYPEYVNVEVGSDEHIRLLLGSPPVSVTLFGERLANSVDCLGYPREHIVLQPRPYIPRKRSASFSGSRSDLIMMFDNRERK